MKKVMLGLLVTLVFQVCTSELSEIDGVIGDHVDAIGGSGGTLEIPNDQFLGEYFSSSNGKDPIYSRIENRIRHDFNSPVKSDVLPSELGAKWTGNFYFESGEYNIIINSDKAIKMMIGSKVILNDPDNSANTTYKVNQQLDGIENVVVEYNLDNDVETDTEPGDPAVVDPAVEVTPITPYIQINGGSWQQTSEVSVNSGDEVIFGPQPDNGGSWNWSGGGTSGSSREQIINPSQSLTAVATYTNDSGGVSTQVFTVTVSDSVDPSLNDTEPADPVVEVNNETPTVEVVIVPVNEPIVPTSVGGTFYSAEELAMWRDRAKNGPFKTKGDAFPNSPNDWERMLEDAAIFGSEDYIIWQGPNPPYPVSKDWKLYYESETWSNMRPTRLMIAAFVDLCQGTTNYTAKIKNALIAQAQVASLDFTNTTIYTNGSLSDQIWGFADWQSKLLLAYDFVGENNFTASEQTLLEDWFEAGALWHTREVNNALDKVFTNRRDGELATYTVKEAYATTESNLHTYDGGPYNAAVNLHYNNRRSAQVAFAAKVGVLTGNTKLINSSIWYIKEFLAYYWYGNGAFSEQQRNSSSSPANGMFYGATCMAPVSEAAKILYEGGYENLFAYTTQAGTVGTASPGIDKGLEWAMLEYIKYIDGTYSDRTYEGNSLNPSDYNSVEWMISAVNLNTYYQNNYIKQTWESNYTSWIKGIGPYPGYYGVAGTCPAYMFMYAK